MEPIETLELRGVSRSFGTINALERFDLTIPGRTFVTLLGPSGCGKSTALNCLAGLLELSSGSILLNGRPIQHLPPEQRSFGMVFQNYALFPHLTVARNVSYSLEVRRMPRPRRDELVAEALRLVHLEAYATRYPAQLSGGQQQRLALARTIVCQPALLLLDEPLSNLDTRLRNEMRIEIKRLHTMLALTTVYVTHDQAEAMSLSDVVVVMRQGRIEQVGTPRAVYTAPASQYVADFMGYTNRMAVTVLQQEQAGWLVRTEGGSILHVTTTVNAPVCSPGQPAQICFQPDAASLVEEPASNTLEGQVLLTDYLGSTFELLIRLPEPADLSVLIQSPHARPIGATVTFQLPPTQVLLFPLEPAATPMAGVAARALRMIPSGAR